MSWECSQWWKLMKYNSERYNILLKTTFFLITLNGYYYVGFSNIILKCMHDVHKYWYNFISYQGEREGENKKKKIP